MSRFHVFILAVFVVFCCIPPGAARSATVPYSLSITPFAGGYLFEGNQNLKNKPVYGLAVGYSLNPNWDIEAVYRWVPDSQFTSGNPQKLTVHAVGGDVLYNFSPERRFVPYVAAGAGLLFLDPDNGKVNNDAMVSYGAGFKYYLTDYLALRADVRHIFDFTVHDQPRENNFYNHLAYTAGITFHIGVKPASPTPVKLEKPLPLVQAPAPQEVNPAVDPASPQPTNLDSEAASTRMPVLPAPLLQEQEPALTSASPQASMSDPEPVLSREGQSSSQGVSGKIMVTGVEFNQDTLLIMTDGRIRNYKTFTLTNPSRLVIDLSDATYGLGAKKIPVNWSGITAVRFGNYPDRLRTVIDASQSEFPQFRIEETGKGLKIILIPYLKKK